MDGAQNLTWWLDGRLEEIGAYGVTLRKGHHHSRASGTRGLWSCGHCSSSSSLQGKILQRPGLQTSPGTRISIAMRMLVFLNQGVSFLPFF